VKPSVMNAFLPGRAGCVGGEQAVGSVQILYAGRNRYLTQRMRHFSLLRESFERKKGLIDVQDAAGRRGGRQLNLTEKVED